ncbi:MAG: phosphate ABC transporter permease subunit PstC [Rhizobacter sp.]|nr:phosphate ABC transporter permease subunit PstC [Chlorobiales bacterium]
MAEAIIESMPLSRQVRTNPAAKNADAAARVAITAVAVFALAIIFLILIFIFKEAKDVFFDAKKRDQVLPTLFMMPANENQAVWTPISKNPKYSLMPMLLGTLKTTLVAMFIAIPISVLAAIYTACFAPRWVREIVKPAIELLAGFPSVVLGFFALIAIAGFMQRLTGADYRLNAIVGGIAVSLTAIPIIFTIAEDALSAVPKAMQEASYGLGATEWETAFYIVLPAAYPGIFAGILLGLGRAFGETLIVLLAAGNALIVSWDFLVPTKTLTATIGAEMGEVVYGDTHYNVLFLIGVFLFVFSVIINSIAEFYVKGRLMKKFSGAA